MDSNETSESYTTVPNKDNSFMLYRLNTDGLVQQLEITLSGKRVEYYRDPGSKEVIKKERQLSEELLNKEGQTYIINWFQAIVNPSTVQGNLKDEVYWNTIANYRVQIATLLFINFNKWGVKEHTYSAIIAAVLNTIHLFITRTINNEERKSYGETYKETTSQQTGGKFKL